MANPFERGEDGGGGGGSGTGSDAASGTAILVGSEDVEILEGFLCPICKRDLRTPERLTVHVEQEHSEEQDLAKALKEMFSFARKKILNLDEPAPEQAKGAEGPRRIANPMSAPGQTVGTDCNHFGYFKAVRNPRLERYASETNKLIIRLDKLLDGCPAEPDQRKRHEQSKVPWIDGKLVKLCPSCAKGFGITRRQHHCRVCGSVMCNDCSFYLSFEGARSIVHPNGDGHGGDGAGADAGGRPGAAGERDEPDTNSFRVCEHCLHLLMNRKEMQDSRSDRPPITKLYERLQQERRDIEPDIPMYERIVDSLYEGDVIFRLSDASALREKIGRTAERIDTVSKRILAIPFVAGSRQEALKKAIRLACISYIKEQMLAIPPLPIEDEIKRVQLQKRQETARRMERERRLALEAYEKCEQQSNSASSEPYNGSSSSSTASTAEMTNGRYSSAAVTMDNWSGTQVATASTGPSSDPLIDQINIVTGYIRQAREALRFDEVATLERNLAELKREFYHRQRLPAPSTGT